MDVFEVNGKIVNDLGAYLFDLVEAFDKNDSHEKYVRMKQVFHQMKLIKDRLDNFAAMIEGVEV